MTSIQLLQICQRALNDIPNQRNLTGRAEFPPPFDWEFSSYDLAAEVDRHLKRVKGFTVILGYPAEACEKAGESYSGVSNADTWEQAVLDVAQDMLDEGAISVDGELSIVDVFEGTDDHSTYPETDRYAVVRFKKEGPVLMDADDAMKHAVISEEGPDILAAAKLLMARMPDMSLRTALREMASPISVDYLPALYEWAEKEEGVWEEHS